MKNRDLSAAAAAMGRTGGKSRSPKKLAAIAQNAKRAGRPRLVWQSDREWTSARIFAGRNGWRVEMRSAIQGEYTDRAVFAPYSKDFPQGQDLETDWNDHTSYASALIHQCEDLKGSKILRNGHLVQ